MQKFDDMLDEFMIDTTSDIDCEILGIDDLYNDNFSLDS